MEAADGAVRKIIAAVPCGAARGRGGGLFRRELVWPSGDWEQ